jgi:hypothetical protein
LALDAFATARSLRMRAFEGAKSNEARNGDLKLRDWRLVAASM